MAARRLPLSMVLHRPGICALITVAPSLSIFSMASGCAAMSDEPIRIVHFIFRRAHIVAQTRPCPAYPQSMAISVLPM